ncbi:MAG: TraR/DksA family transcriptional regulator [Acidimicrobiia bacterium]
MARASKASTASKKSAAKKATPASKAKKATGTKAANGGTATKAKATTATAKKAATKAAPKKATAKASTAKTATPAPKKAASTKTARKKSPFDSKFLERMRKLLHVERDTYERQAKQLRAEADSLVMDLDPGDVQFDEESGEGDTIAVERGRDLALAAKALEMIEEIDHALAKFDEGTYGICEVSGEPIPQERLEAIPWAREKVEFKVGGFGRR